MDGASKFHFDWKDLVKSGLSVKDAIAPTAFAFKNSRTFQMGGIFCAASFLSITASDISDQLLKDFLDMDSSQIVTMHIQSVDQNKAIKTIKHTITELDRSKIKNRSVPRFCKLSRKNAMPRSATQLDAGKRGMRMNFNHEELMLMMLYNTGTRLGLIHELRLMQCYLMPDETALRELSEGVIEKLKLLTDAEFAELKFPLD